MREQFITTGHPVPLICYFLAIWTINFIVWLLTEVGDNDTRLWKSASQAMSIRSSSSSLYLRWSFVFSNLILRATWFFSSNSPDEIGILNFIISSL
ncbi:hypothetical protein Hanom_Chr00s000001g01593691 [Helianthus anomalus]